MRNFALVLRQEGLKRVVLSAFIIMTISGLTPSSFAQANQAKPKSIETKTKLKAAEQPVLVANDKTIPTLNEVFSLFRANSIHSAAAPSSEPALAPGQQAIHDLFAVKSPPPIAKQPNRSPAVIAHPSDWIE